MAVRKTLIAAALTLALAPAVAIGEPMDCPVYILERAGDGFRVRTEVLAVGKSKAFLFGPGTAFVATVVPTGPGGSGDVVQVANPHATMVRCSNGVIEILTQVRGGEAREWPPVEVSVLRRYRTQVNVTSAEGWKGVFVIEPDGTISRDTLAPVLDMFGGKVPLSPGDVSITTLVREVEEEEGVSGEVSLKWGGPWLLAGLEIAGGGSGDVIVDLGASRTLVSRRLLPPGTETKAMVSVEYGAGGERTERAAAPGTLGGNVAGIERALVPGIQAGGVGLGEAVVNVVDGFPDLLGLPLVGVLGLDLLRRGGLLRIEKGDDRGRLVFGGSPAPGAALEVRFSMVSGLIALPGRIGGRSVPLILDTGARFTMVTEATIEGEGVEAVAGDPELARGMDGKPIEMRPARVSSLGLGDGELEDLRVYVGPLPVLEGMGLTGPAGLLGQDVWQRFRALEVDWDRGVVRFYR